LTGFLGYKHQVGEPNRVFTLTDKSDNQELYYLYPEDLLAILRKAAQLLLNRLGRLDYIQGVLSQLSWNT
jgi:hypothetical protein